MSPCIPLKLASLRVSKMGRRTIGSFRGVNGAVWWCGLVVRCGVNNFFIVPDRVPQNHFGTSRKTYHPMNPHIPSQYLHLPIPFSHVIFSIEKSTKSNGKRPSSSIRLVPNPAPRPLHIHGSSTGALDARRRSTPLPHDVSPAVVAVCAQVSAPKTLSAPRARLAIDTASNIE